MGIDSAWANKRTKEYLDVRGFYRFTNDEMRLALGSQEEMGKLVGLYTNNDRATEEYRAWLTALLWDFGHRGGATLDDLALFHDHEYAPEDPGWYRDPSMPGSWYDLDDKGFRMVGGVHDFNPESPVYNSTHEPQGNSQA